ncbi:TRADD-N-associated membrane domain-containing protein [Phormidesmis sp. 146-33]
MDNFHQDRLQERLRQARLSFNAALIATSTSAVISVAGFFIMGSGNFWIGASTTTGGGLSSLVCAHFLKLAKDANDRLDKDFHQ